MTERGSTSCPGEHPIVPIMLGDAALAGRMAERLLEKGVYVDRLLLPRRAAGQGAHPRAGLGRARAEDLQFAIDAFTKVRDEMGK